MIHGSCLCGSTKFTLHGKLRSARFCYCTNCTKFAGTSPATWAMADRASLRFEAQDAPVTKFNSGRGKRCFCATCGSPVWFESLEHPETYAIPLGVLDDGDIPMPAMNLWTRSKPGWCSINNDLPGYETDPWMDQNMNKPVFRPARKQDCPVIAALYRISSDGVAEYIWSQLAQPGEDPLTVGEQRYAREDTVFSYLNCTVIELDDRVIGMLVAFPMHADPAEVESDPVLAPYSRLEEDDSYYICGMAVMPEHRGRGLGTRLLALAEEQAVNKGFDKLSLVVFEQNSGAKKLYDRHGYREAGREAVVPHPSIHYTGDAILMVKELDRH